MKEKARLINNFCIQFISPTLAPTPDNASASAYVSSVAQASAYAYAIYLSSGAYTKSCNRPRRCLRAIRADLIAHSAKISAKGL